MSCPYLVDGVISEPETQRVREVASVASLNWTTPGRSGLGERHLVLIGPVGHSLLITGERAD